MCVPINHKYFIQGSINMEPHVRCLFYCLLGWSANVFDPCRWSGLLKTLQLSHNVPFGYSSFLFITQDRDPFWISLFSFSFQIAEIPFGSLAFYCFIFRVYFRDVDPSGKSFLELHTQTERHKTIFSLLVRG